MISFSLLHRTLVDNILPHHQKDPPPARDGISSSKIQINYCRISFFGASSNFISKMNRTVYGYCCDLLLGANARRERELTSYSFKKLSSNVLLSLRVSDVIMTYILRPANLVRRKPGGVLRSSFVGMIWHVRL